VERRAGVDRRFGTELRASSGVWLSVEPPAEHVRNAMQLLMGALDSEPPMTAEAFARLAEATLTRLGLALATLENRR
jgi:hypothetical protein